MAVEILLNPDTNHDFPLRQTPTLVSEQARFNDMAQHWTNHGFGVWLVFRADNPNRLLGFTGVRHSSIAGRPALNLGYRLTPSAWGHGYAREAAAAAVTQAKAVLPKLQVFACTTLDNVGSQRTALAAGLERRRDLDADNGDHKEIYFTQPAKVV